MRVDVVDGGITVLVRFKVVIRTFLFSLSLRIGLGVDGVVIVVLDGIAPVIVVF